MVDVAHAKWRKSVRSVNAGDCVDVATLPHVIAVRDSKDPAGPALKFTVDEWRAFLGGVRNGEFDV